MAAENDVLSEIEVLQSIYLEELQTNKRDDGGWEVSLVLYPSTGEDSLSQFVRLTLTLTLDLQLCSVQKCLQTEAESCLGSPVLYQLIEKAKEILTESNIPHGNCVICLYGFKDGEAFTKTRCYHYFHSHCLGRYITHSETELQEREKELEQDKTRERTDDEELTVVCPVCREPLTYNVDQLLSNPAPSFPKLEGAVIGVAFRQKWAELQNLLERQKAKGGIIDTEAESNRFLIHINEPPPNSDISADGDASLSQSLPSLPPASTNQITAPQLQHAGHSHRRGGPGHQCHHQGPQGHFRGPRRRGRGRPHTHPGRPVPPTDHLDKLSLSSEKHDNFHSAPPANSHDAPNKARLQENSSHPELGQAQLSQLEKEEGEGRTELGQQEAPVPKDGQPIRKSSLDTSKTDIPPSNDMEMEAGLGHRERGRRRGPRGSAQQPDQRQERHFRGTDQWDARGGGYHRYWNGRGQRSRGGVNYPRSREGGAHMAGGRGFHQRVGEGEVGREGAAL
ncbi:E3 ubiquitin-protein ligase RNF25 isoform X3 [Coregonus clupeaformis]|uniref:E3 ubiquitin-protein ligase RNF25 isoform X3 n=1 Tax=Coregonus clupeaformis TaxID=59861 RepID=UPI001E1C5AA3|nr:E3 ubiquitin-protein ligase RNF25 isoform X3 [Coregonus clupeaformis]